LNISFPIILSTIPLSLLFFGKTKPIAGSEFSYNDVVEYCVKIPLTSTAS